MDLQVYNMLLSTITIGCLVLLSARLYSQYRKAKTPYIYKNLSVDKDGRLFLPVKRGRKKFMFLIDTGCTHSLIDYKVAQELRYERHTIPQVEGREVKLIDRAGTTAETICSMYSTVTIRIKNKTIEHKMFVIEHLNADGVIGMDLLNKIKARIETKKGIISIIK